MTLAALASVEVESLASTRLHDGYAYLPNRKNESLEPTSRQNNGDGGMQNTRGAYARKFRGDSRKMFFRNVDTAALCKEALSEAYGDEQSVHKAIANDTGMSPAAAENWTAGDNPMSLTAFLNAFHNNPKFNAHARKILLMEKEVNPEFQAALSQFIREAQRVPAATQVIGKGEE